MIVPTCRCAFFAAVMLLGVFMSDIAPAKKKSQANVGAPVWGAALWARCRR